MPGAGPENSRDVANSREKHTKCYSESFSVLNIKIMRNGRWRWGRQGKNKD